jgi:cyclopropane fatty-acyl-phospholipid synthase-like methyltransferase
VLRAIDRVLRPGGRLAFAVITFADGITAEEKLWAGGVSPENIDAGPGYPELLAEAGFVDIDVTDVTEQYGATIDAWVAAWDDEAAGIGRLMTAEEFADRQSRLRRSSQAVRRGLRRRYLISATSP